MKTSLFRYFSVFLFIFIGLSANAVFGWENCKSSASLKPTLAASKIPGVLSASETDVLGDEKTFSPKPLEKRSAEQLAAAKLKCYAALHRDMDEFSADASCEPLNAYTAHAPHPAVR